MRRATAVLALLLLSGAAQAAADPAVSPPAVDDARLLAAPGDARDWLVPGGGYDNAHFSALTQIDAANVAQLVPRWTFHTGLRGGFETTPLVADGVMYLTTSGDDVVALEAASGTLRWRYHHVLRFKPCCGPANRGAALGYGRVYIATVDARLVALDAATGSILWDVPLAGVRAGKTEVREALASSDRLRGEHVIGETGIFANMAPLVYGGKVVVGVTGVGNGLHLGSQGTNDAHAAGVVGFAGDLRPSRLLCGFRCGDWASRLALGYDPRAWLGRSVPSRHARWRALGSRPGVGESGGGDLPRRLENGRWFGVGDARFRSETRSALPRRRQSVAAVRR